MEQLDMFAPIQNYKKTIKINNGEYIYIPNFYDKEIADSYLKRLISDIKWKQESMNMYGKQILFPRLTSWYGQSDKPYSFSGITLNPHPWSKELLEIKFQFNKKRIR
jgi:alkylated DNA repair dioxygenase AlkB